MALWEYKVITSGVHGFATPALLEAHLNTLGKDEWEIVNFQTQPNNPLAFTGVVRRSTQRDWVPPEIAIAAAPASKPVSIFDTAAPAPAKPAAPESHDAEKAETPAAESGPKDTIRTVRDTDRDLDPDAQDDDAGGDERDEWDNLGIDDDLPTFFDALKPHFRNNQKGPGQSVALDFLCKRWELRETEIVGALKECGMTIPETEEAEPEYFEFEDDLFWVNRNNRGQLFINTREKPRPKFRIAAAKPLSPDDPAHIELTAERAEEQTRIEKRNAERAEQQAAAMAAAAARAEEAAKRRAAAEASAAAAGSAGHQPGSETPVNAPASESAEATSADSSSENSNSKTQIGIEGAGPALLDRIRPMMRRNRHGPGYSGSVSFLARALKITDADLVAELAAMNLHVPATSNEKPIFVEIENALYWINKDNRGGIWINGRENKNGAKKPASPGSAGHQPGTEPSSAAPPTEQPAEQPAGIAEAPPPAATREEKPGQQLELPAAAQSEKADAARPEANPQSSNLLTAVRLLLKPNKRGTGVSGEVGYLARALDKNETEFVAKLTNTGLVVPPDAETKPTFVEHDGEIFWFSFFEKDGVTSIWLNAKPSKKKSDRAPRTRKPRTEKAEK